MKNCKGFTLLELLIAATIVGGLAVLATVSYRNSAAEARIQAAKTRTEVLAVAVQQFKAMGGTVAAENPMADVNGLTCASNTITPANLIGCRYLDNGGWSDAYVTYYICNGKTGNCANSSVDNPLACMTGNSDQLKLPGQYKNGYRYCSNGYQKGEYTGS